MGFLTRDGLLARRGFLDPLRVTATGQRAPDTRYGPGNPIYTVDQPLTYQTAGQSYTVPAGYQTDLASIPQRFQQRPPDQSPAAGPGALHDWLYTTHAVPRAAADRLFRQALRDEGVPLGQRLLMWGAVRRGGGPAYDARLGWAPNDP